MRCLGQIFADHQITSFVRTPPPQRYWPTLPNKIHENCGTQSNVYLLDLGGAPNVGCVLALSYHSSPIHDCSFESEECHGYRPTDCTLSSPVVKVLEIQRGVVSVGRYPGCDGWRNVGNSDKLEDEGFRLFRDGFRFFRGGIPTLLYSLRRDSNTSYING